MRLAMLNPFALVGSEFASPAQNEATLRELYSCKPHIAATLGIGLAGLTAALSGAFWAGISATLIAIVCLLFRISIEYRFVARVPGPLDAKWIRLFVIGSLLSGFG